MAGTTNTKGNIISFKADASMLEALEGIENRSEFIRAAVLAALDNICPLCRGRGILTPNQKKHWASLAADHEIERCTRCHESHLVCRRSGSRRSAH